MKVLVMAYALGVCCAVCGAEALWQGAVKEQIALSKKDDAFQQTLARMLKAEKTLPEEEEPFMQLAELLASRNKAYHFKTRLSDAAVKTLPVQQWSLKQFEAFRQTRLDAVLKAEALFSEVSRQEALSLWPELSEGLESFTLYDSVCLTCLSDYSFQNAHPRILEIWQVSAARRGAVAAESMATVRLMKLNFEKEKRSPEACREALLKLLEDPRMKGDAKAVVLFEASEYAESLEKKYDVLQEALEAVVAQTLREKIIASLEWITRKRGMITCETLWPASPVELTVHSSNLGELTLNFFAVDEAAFIAKSDEASAFIANGPDPVFKTHTPVLKVAVKPEPAARFEETETVVSVSERFNPGFYLVCASDASGTFYSENCMVTAADLRVVTLDASGPGEDSAAQVYVARAVSGLPVAGATVEIVRKNNPVRAVASGVTDRTGAARIEVEPQKMRQPHDFLIRVTAGEERVLVPWIGVKLEHPEPDSRTGVVNWYFDRAVYRPGQTIQYFGIITEKDSKNDRYGVVEASGVFTATWSAGSRKIVLGTESFSTDAHGGFSGSFALSETLPPGNIEFCADARSFHNRNASVSVGMYRRATYEVMLDSAPTDAVFGREITLTGRARMLNGTPLQNAAVSWSISKRPHCFWGVISDSSDEASGKTVTAADGSFSIPFMPTSPADAKDLVAMRYTLSVTAVDVSGETRRAWSTFFVDVKSFALGLSVPEWNPNGAVISVHSYTPAGDPVSVNGSLTFFPCVKKSEEEESWYVPKLKDLWKPVAESYSTVSFETIEGKGEVTVTLPPGIWHGVASAFDARSGSMVTNGATFRVIAPGQTYAGEEAFVFLKEKAQCRVGETSRFYWATALGDSVLRIDAVNRNGIFYSAVTKPETSGLITLPVTESLRGDFTVYVSMVRNNRVYTQTNKIFVPWDLNLELEAVDIPKKVKPAEAQRWQVKVSTPGARVSAVLYDAALGLIRANRWNTLTGALPFDFWRNFRQDDFGLSTRAMFNLIPDFEASVDDVPPPVDSIQARCVVASTMTGVVSSRDPGLGSPVEVRTDFRETAFFKAFAETDSEGIATFSFTMPDSLTRWKFMAMAYTDTLQSGVMTAEIESVKDLMLTPNLPRFLREGDTCLIPVKLDNAGAIEQRGAVSLDVDGAPMVAYPYALPAGASTNFTWSVTPRQAGEMTLAFTAQTDAERRTLPVLSSRIAAVDAIPFTLTNGAQTVATTLAEHLESPTFEAKEWRINLIDDPFFSVLAALPPEIAEDMSADQAFNAYSACLLADELIRRDPGVRKAGTFFSDDIARAILRNRALERLNLCRVEKAGWGWFGKQSVSPFITDLILVGRARLHRLGIACEDLPDIAHEGLTPARAYARSFFELSEEEKIPLRDYVGRALQTEWPVQQRRMLAIAAFRLGVPDDGLPQLYASLTDDPVWGVSWPRENCWWEGWRTPVESHVLGMEMLLQAGDTNTCKRAAQWLLQHKRLNAWETPRATGAAVWMLLQCCGFLETGASVAVFDADHKPLAKPGISDNLASVIFEKSGDGLAFGSIVLSYEEELGTLKTTGDSNVLSVEKLFRVKRGDELVAGEIRVGDEVVVRLVIHAAQEISHIHVADGRAAGCEPVETLSGYRSGYYLSLEDTATHFYFETLPRGTTMIDCSYRVFNAGDFQGGIATVESFYAPDFNARASAEKINVKK